MHALAHEVLHCDPKFLAYQDNHCQFENVHQWVYQFMDCHNLVQCSITSVAQHGHDVEVGLNFVRTVQECIADLEIPWHAVTNMDQTAVNFENFGNGTIDVCSACQVLVKTTWGMSWSALLWPLTVPNYHYMLFSRELLMAILLMKFVHRTLAITHAASMVSKLMPGMTR